MIRLRAAADRDTVRRLLGLALVILFVVVLVAGFAHAAHAEHGGEAAHDCGLCLALLQIAVALPVLAALTIARVADPQARSTALLAVPRGRRDARTPPARGPPSSL